MVLFSWERFFHNIPLVFRYFPVTLKIVLIAGIFGTIGGIIIALARINRIPLLGGFFAGFVSFMRGTPMLVQLMIVYYGLPQLLMSLFGLDVNDIWPRIMFVYNAFSLNHSAFLSEVFRSSIASIPRGQMDAGLSVGLTRLQTFRRIVLPKAARIAVPGFGAELLGLFGSSALAFMIGVIDLMGRAKTVGLYSGHYVEAYVFVAVIYVIASLSIKSTFTILDKKILNRHGA
jgi:L-cystine transport system permease protein